MAVSRVKGGNGGRGSLVMVIENSRNSNGNNRVKKPSRLRALHEIKRTSD
jgi:hypothetical protein